MADETRRDHAGVEGVDADVARASLLLQRSPASMLTRLAIWNLSRAKTAVILPFDTDGPVSKSSRSIGARIVDVA